VERRAVRAPAEEALIASDPWRFTTIAHAGRDVLGPVSLASVDWVLDHLPPSGARVNVLDVGCGKGELLVRTLERTGGSGIGVEPNPAFAADARERLERRLGPGRGVIIEAVLDASTLPARGFDLGICTGALHAFGDWPAALRGIAALVTEDGWALMGPTYWKRRPHPDYLAAIEGEEDEAMTLPPTLAAAEDAGWHVVASHESTPEEWDDYEHSYAAKVRHWCDEHPNDPDMPGFRERIENWAAAYAKWGRVTMGYALVLLRREG